MTAAGADLRDLLRLAEAPAEALAVSGARLRWASPPALALVLAAWISKGGRVQSLWVDAPSEAEARTLAQDLQALLPEAGVAHFPGFAAYAGGESSPPGMVLRDRLSTLVGLLERRVQVLVTGPLTASERLPHPTWFQKQKLELRIGAEVPRDLLLETLVALGYRRTEMAGAPGEFSSRGMVVDLWPDHLDQPLRLETFGDELERLSPFDPDTQRRTGESLESLTLYPRFEGERGDGQVLLAAVASRADRTAEPEDDLAFRRARLATHGHFPGEELFHPLLAQPKGQLVHWVPPCLRVRLDPAWEEALREAERARIEEGLATLRRGGVVCPDFEDRFLPSDPSRISLLLTEWQSEATVPVTVQPLREFQGRLPDLAEQAQELALTGFRVVLAGSTPGMRDRFAEFLRDYDLPQAYGTETGCRALRLNLSAGVLIKECRLALFTEREVFGRKAIQAAPKKSRSAAFLSDLRDLKPGDRVVHLDHGIGEFLGFATLTVGGEEQEVLQLRYADGGQLNVSLERADLVQRYTGAEGHLPPLDKLGGASWAKVKRRAKKAIRDMADELLKLYAQRKLEKGHAYPPDGPDMAAFDASFPFTPTPDQIEAIEAVKADLESPRPMDRLLVGDVGFGKTEVAMRAAAKVALEGRQVAVLCPTTVLCFQHFRTFRERFSGFPIRIEMLNRFVDPAEQKRILQEVADGKVEIVIGTHQLLGARVTFADLGLVVVDEEQRFGVGHKEKLKKLRLNVDQLALSATPIPRTLHMSLTGLREISLIETPPKDRLAIETVVAPWSDELVQTAVQFELRRGGQVYLVHNRVESIISIAERVRELVPDARVAVGHGQMSDEGLEQVMLGFMEGRIDVLVATTIVENGLDVPNANTLIVHRADAFGLSQLYQLRGRVGRSDVPAYAYLMIPPKHEISEDARKRLQALEDFSELGSGFRVAAMDLELRGAGNLLGGEQSGHIHDIGFELYVKLLEETLQELQGQPSTAFEVKVDGLAPGAQLSRRWIDQAAERLVAYKRISRLREEKDLDLYRLDLEDRFGRVPEDDPDTQRFFEVLKVKLRAQHLAVSEVTVQSGRLKLRLSPQTPVDAAQLMAWVRARKDAQLNPDGAVLLPMPPGEGGPVIQAQRVLAEWAKMAE
ncbi:transcription-repair coupling factor [Geothrix alkalitolerans]|uniref:transcription-repair coupling factor n=1 Tax=Geothrix alkalitolerans TaxID=2922724 RepID=UPI001FAF24A8|nr:transcription-repair coupling factor [Geothrix alkalitolerans]